MLEDMIQAPRLPHLAFKPYVLWRRCMLPFRRLVPLVPERTWELLLDAENRLVERRRLAGGLGNALYALIPELGPGQRRNVLNLRRDLHNDRMPDPAMLGEVERLLDPESRALLSEWRESRAAHETLLAAAAAMLVTELEKARRRLGRIASSEHFLRGVQLSGRHLYRNVRKYSSETKRLMRMRRSRKLRQTEASIVRYAFRMAVRTSPFGSFTEIGAHPWLASSHDLPRRRRHRARLNRRLLTRMVNELRHVEGSDRVLLLRLNNTARALLGRIELFARGREGSEHAYWSERFVDVRAIGPVEAVVAALADGPQSRAAILERLAKEGLPAAEAVQLIERLIQAGLCQQDLALPDQTVAFAAAVAARLRNDASPQVQACVNVFETLQKIEDDFCVATVDERDRLLDCLEASVRRFGDICGVDQPLSTLRAPVFEDVVADGPARTWCPRLIEDNRAHFLRLQQVLPILDQSTFAKLGLYRWFLSCFGKNGRCEEFLGVYRAFAQQSAAEITDLMQAATDPVAAHVRKLRRALVHRLADIVTAGDKPVVQLDNDFFDDLVAALPPTLPQWTEAAYRLQVTHEPPDGIPALVLNEATAGYGMCFSRFCDVLESADPTAWSLSSALRDAIAGRRPRQADVTAVLDVNINLHPSLTPVEIVYPGSVSSGIADVLTLQDLAIEADASRRMLWIVNRHSHERVELTPMNFLYQVATPMLYRFLCVFSPLGDGRIGFWDLLRQWTRRDHRHLPRLTFGDLVLERRRWSVPSVEIHELGDGSNVETIEALLATQRWFNARGLPQECFFRVCKPIDKMEAELGGWPEATRRWAVSAHGARRKRQYLDFRNPFLMRLLAHHLDGADEGVVIFEECLPATQLYRQAVESAEEFIVECRLSSVTESAARTSYELA